MQIYEKDWVKYYILKESHLLKLVKHLNKLIKQKSHYVLLNLLKLGPKLRYNVNDYGFHSVALKSVMSRKGVGFSEQNKEKMGIPSE